MKKYYRPLLRASNHLLFKFIKSSYKYNNYLAYIESNCKSIIINVVIRKCTLISLNFQLCFFFFVKRARNTAKVIHLAVHDVLLHLLPNAGHLSDNHMRLFTKKQNVFSLACAFFVSVYSNYLYYCYFFD